MQKRCEGCGGQFAYRAHRGAPRKYCAVCYEERVELGLMGDVRDPAHKSFMREYMRGYENRTAADLALSQRERNELKARAGKCACCGSPERLQVHHCHETGFVDGVNSVLCGECNGALGQVGDDPDRLAMLVAYQRTFLARAQAAA